MRWICVRETCQRDRFDPVALCRIGRAGRLDVDVSKTSEAGAGCRNRTRDLMITNQLLYQLS